MIQNSEDKTALHKMLLCEKHNNEQMVYYCNNCNGLACTKCLSLTSPGECQHSYDRVSNAYKKYETELEFLLCESKNVSTLSTTLEKALDNLQVSHDQVKSKIEETFQSLNTILDTCKNEVLIQLEFAKKQQKHKIMDTFEEAKKITDNIGGVEKFATRLLKNGSESENVAFKKIILTRMGQLFSQMPDLDVNAKLFYSPEIGGFENHCQKYFGHIETEQVMNSAVRPISPPTPRTNFSTDHVFSPSMVDSRMFNFNLATLSLLNVEDNPISSTMSKPNALGDSLNTPTSLDDAIILNNLKALAKLDNFNNDFNNIFGDPSISNLCSKMIIAPPTRTIRYPSTTSLSLVTLFGEKGRDIGQFWTPSGFCLSPTGDIVIADTTNHRIQSFGKDGTFKTEFGRLGIRNGFLCCPRRVVFLSHNQIVVCDLGSIESDVSRAQIFEYPAGKCIKTIPLGFIGIVTGVAVTANRQLVFVGFHPILCILNVNEDDNKIKIFNCARYVQNPSDIAVRNQDYYVSDFKGHSIVVFNDQGVCLRRFGGDTITCFPIGIDIAENGDILVGDCHGNRFHVAVFSQDGTHLTDLKYPYLEVSYCRGLRIASGGNIVTLAKRSNKVFVFNATVPIVPNVKRIWKN